VSFKNGVFKRTLKLLNILRLDDRIDGLSFFKYNRPLVNWQKL